MRFQAAAVGLGFRGSEFWWGLDLGLTPDEKECKPLNPKPIISLRDSFLGSWGSISSAIRPHGVGVRARAGNVVHDNLPHCSKTSPSMVMLLQKGSLRAPAFASELLSTKSGRREVYSMPLNSRSFTSWKALARDLQAKISKHSATSTHLSYQWISGQTLKLEHY